MPVRIETGDTSNDPRVISLQQFVFGRANFSLHYYYTSSEAAFGGDILQAPWQDLQDAVDLYTSTTGVPENEVALRFVHCFSMAEEKLYTRVQICQMIPSATPPPPGAATVYDLVTAGSLWYEIRENSFGTTNDQQLFGPDYLENFYYKVEPQAASMEKLADGPTVYVKNLVLPWAQEIKLMYTQNHSPANASLKIASVSFEGNPIYSNVLWPHGIVLYICNSAGTDMLNNHDYIAIFRNKGADYSTLCPPNCAVYIQPAL